MEQGDIKNCREPGHSTSLLPCPKSPNSVKLGGPLGGYPGVHPGYPGVHPSPRGSGTCKSRASHVAWCSPPSNATSPALSAGSAAGNPHWIQTSKSISGMWHNVTETQRTCCLLLGLAHYSTLHTCSYLWVSSSKNAVMIFKTFDSFQVFSLETQIGAVFRFDDGWCDSSSHFACYSFGSDSIDSLW